MPPDKTSAELPLADLSPPLPSGRLWEADSPSFSASDSSKDKSSFLRSAGDFLGKPLYFKCFTGTAELTAVVCHTFTSLMGCVIFINTVMKKYIRRVPSGNLNNFFSFSFAATFPPVSHFILCQLLVCLISLSLFCLFYLSLGHKHRPGPKHSELAFGSVPGQ